MSSLWVILKEDMVNESSWAYSYPGRFCDCTNEAICHEHVKPISIMNIIFNI